MEKGKEIIEEKEKEDIGLTKKEINDILLMVTLLEQGMKFWKIQGMFSKKAEKYMEGLCKQFSLSAIRKQFEKYKK